MNKTDLVFYLSYISGFLALLAKLTTNLLSTATVSWIVVVSALVGFTAYQFYEYFQGKSTPPTPIQ